MHTPSGNITLVQELIDLSPVPVALAGGALRDAAFGREPKDYDLLVSRASLAELVGYLVEAGFEITTEMADTEAYGNTDDLETRYADWIQMQRGADDDALPLIVVDLLAIGGDLWVDDVDPLDNFVAAVYRFDNTMNLWLYHKGSTCFLANHLSAWGQAVQLRQVSPERAVHVRDIAEAIGWTYVPLAE